MKNLQVLQLIRLLFQLMKFVKDIQNVTSFDMVQVSSRLFQFVNVDILLNHSSYTGKKLSIFSQKGNVNA